MEKLKSSLYNVLTEVKETNEWLLYNILTGGIEILTAEEGRFLYEIPENKSFDVDLLTDELQIVVQALKNKGYLINSEIDEVEKYSLLYKSKQERFFSGTEKSITLTIGTTITCNMGCAYCYEFEKPNKSLRDPKIMDALIIYLEDMIQKSPVNNWLNLIVTWYGGEPLINKSAIAELTPMLMELCEKHSIVYSAKIITNGILLTPDTWRLLKDNHVTNAQITIDGSQETHDISRPLKNGNASNYTQILENISKKPAEINVTIRINTDNKIAATMPKFFSDLNDYGIWPQMHSSISLSPSWLRTYPDANETDVSGRMTNDDFFRYLLDFRQSKLRLYNFWAHTQNLKKARLSWLLPSLQDECATWTSQYSLVIDPVGNIHKCWETIHEEQKAATSVFEKYDSRDFTSYMAYDRCELNAICRNCKFLPVCDQLTCSYEVLKHHDSPPPSCTAWKNNTEDILKLQYLNMVNYPEEFAAPENMMKENTGHSNK
ncbi:radical SAM protein [Pedobacter sp. AW31-3R]|uniref:radical SAM protein n=1 Tax=Pedobacter sp. AW31-3R TaxID=3445781 RepID=UPI003FA12803